MVAPCRARFGEHSCGGDILCLAHDKRGYAIGKVGTLDEDPAPAEPRPLAPTEPNRTQRRAEEKRARKAKRRLH